MKRLRHAVTLLAPAVVLAGFVATLTAVFATARRVVTPARRTPDTAILSVDTGAQTIELSRTPDTELPGRYGLFTSGTYDYVKLGTVLGVDARSVRRKLLTQIESGSEIDRNAAFSGWYYSDPDELHLPYESVLIGSAAGPCPAWLFPAESSARDDLWVIQVHGRGTNKTECLRAVPVLRALGATNLLISYRNDGEAPRSRGGSYGLGTTEWEDVDAAIAYAQRHGAQRIVLMGWSMGGAISLQTALNSPRKDSVVGLILESPVVDWRSVLNFQAGAAGIREPLPRWALGALESPLSARLGGAEAPISFDSLDMVARSAELTTPTLILHSDDDGFVPVDASRALAEARPDLVTMPSFTVARHTKLWNYDQASFTDAITTWMVDQGFSASDAPVS